MLFAHSLKWVANAFMLCVCPSWSEYIRFSQLQILQVKTSETFTSEQWQLTSDYARACSTNNGKKLCELCAHTQVYLWLRMRRFIFVSAAVINARTKRANTIRSYSPLMTNLSTRRYLEYMHMLFTVKFSKTKRTKKDPIFLWIRILPRICIWQ